MTIATLIAAVAVGALFIGCGVSRTSTSATPSSTHVRQQSDTPEKLKDSFQGCLIAEFEKNHRTSFDLIKTQCFEAGLARCAGQTSCKQQFTSATRELMTHSKTVDCDSGYCTVLY